MIKFLMKNNFKYLEHVTLKYYIRQFQESQRE